MGKGLKLCAWVVVGGLFGSSASGQEVNEHRPVISPDGERVVFMLQGPETDGDWELFVADRSGKELRRLTRSPGWDGYAVFSPDGSRLAFDRSTDGGDGAKQPHILALESGATHPLGSYEGWLSVSDWSPEHGLLAFWELHGQRDLYLLDESGVVQRRLTSTEELSEHDAHFSPDGQWIVMASGPAEGDGPTTLELITATGSDRTILVESQGRIYGAAWSPDGAAISFTDAPDGDNGDVFLIDVATRRVDRLTDDPAWDHMPVWGPVGESILFTSYRSGLERVYLLDVATRGTKPWRVP